MMFLLGTKDNTGLVATHEERKRPEEKEVTETERKERRLLVVVARELGIIKVAQRNGLQIWIPKHM